MKTPLRVLVIEDSEFDARMLIRLLNRGGYDTDFLRVETADALKESLEKEWDLILADYNLPGFNAPQALEIVQAKGIDVPFLIISGGIGEDIAVASMKAGAHDYLMKGNLARLVPAVERELREAKVRAERRSSERRYSLLWETATDAILLMDTNSVIQFANPAVETIFGYRPDEVVGKNMTLLLPVRAQHSTTIPLFKNLEISSDDKRRMVETVGVKKDSNDVLVEVVYNEMELDGRQSYVAFIRDITRRKKAERELLEHEEQFRVAREIQQHLFPEAPPNIPGFDIAGASFPADAAGGDYYDYVEMAGGGIGLVVGDVTGHGIGPALLMAETRAYVRIVALNRQDVGQVLTRSNAALSDDIGEERYVTMFLCRLDASARQIHYASAGHPPALVISPDGTIRAKLKRTGIPLGIKRNTEYEEVEPVQLESGDIFALLTDGVDEAIDAEGEFFGQEGAARIIHEHRNLSAANIVQTLYREVKKHSADPSELDDVTAIVVKVL